MLITGLILVFLAGLSVVSALSPALSHAERLGLSFPAGVATVTFMMLLADAAGIPLTGTVNLLLALAVLAVCGAVCFLRRAELVPSLCHKPEWARLNFVWAVLLIFIAWLEYANLEKCMFFPTYDRDSMAAFDTIGYLIGQEHTLRSLSIFTGDYMPGIHGPGSPIAYTPMLELAYGFVYSLGAETSKAVPGLLYLSFLLAFYGVTARFSSRTVAMLATLFVLLTPEMTSFSSLSATNSVHAVYASLGIVCVAAWFRQGRRDDLWLAGFLLASNVWVRAEGIVFILAAGLFVLVGAVRTRRFAALVPVALSLVPAVAWTLFTKLFDMTSQGILITRPLLDGAKASAVWDGAWALITNTQYYGWTFLVALLALLADVVWFALKRKNALVTAGLLLLTMFLYFLVLYHIDYRWDSMDNVLRYSAKRFMFCYVPIAWFFAASVEPVRLLAQKLDNWLSH